MHPADIKAALEKKGATQSSIARRVGVTTTTVWQVIHNRTHSVRVERAIADVIGLAPDVIWPKNFKHRDAAT